MLRHLATACAGRSGSQSQWLAPGHVVQGAQALGFGRILSALPVTGVSIK